MSAMIAPFVRRRASIVRVALSVLAVTLLTSGCSQPNLSGAFAEAERYMTESADLERYFAYSNAALGRPYQRFYVRSVEEWHQTFEGNAAQRPADRPTVTPTRPLVPYRDFLVEYPPGFFLIAVPPALVSTTPRGYAIVFGAFMLLLLWAAALVCGRIAILAGWPISQTRLVSWILIAAVCLGTLVTQRYDAVVAFLLCVMCWATLARRPVILGVAAGAAIAIKIVPALVAGICGLFLWREHRRGELWQALGIAALVAVAISAPILFLAPSGFVEMLRYHIDRPLEVGSTAAGLLGLWHSIDPSAVAASHSYGSGNVVGRLAPAALAVTNIAAVSAIAAVYVAAWRRFGARSTPEGRARLLLSTTTAVVAAFIATGKVGSPQYLTWLLPIGVLVTLLDRRWLPLAALLATLVIAQTVYTIVPFQVEAFRPWASALVVARNTVLVGWAWSIASGTGC
ncbi:MAG TPA: glycosyltransferase 87 family protein [Vicinamibacterales bacterium]